MAPIVIYPRTRKSKKMRIIIVNVFVYLLFYVNYFALKTFFFSKWNINLNSALQKILLYSIDYWGTI